MTESEARATRGLALASGALAIGSAVSIATFSAAGEPFGLMNDLGNAGLGIAVAALAWRLRNHLDPRSRGLVLSCALAGAACSATGSALVISGATGWFLAGLVSTLGYAGLGAWLLAVNRGDGLDWPRGLRRMGVTAGSLMLVGITAAPAIVMGFDDSSTAPAWTWLPFFAWLGIYLIYPAWAIWLGISARAGRTQRPGLTEAMAGR